MLWRETCKLGASYLRRQRKRIQDTGAATNYHGTAVFLRNQPTQVNLWRGIPAMSLACKNILRQFELDMLCLITDHPHSNNIESCRCIIKHSDVVQRHDNFLPSLGMLRHQNQSHNSCWMNGASVASSLGIAQTTGWRLAIIAQHANRSLCHPPRSSSCRCKEVKEEFPEILVSCHCLSLFRL